MYNYNTCQALAQERAGSLQAEARHHRQVQEARPARVAWFRRRHESTGQGQTVSSLRNTIEAGINAGLRTV